MVRIFRLMLVLLNIYTICCREFLSLAQQSNTHLGHLVVEVSISHTIRHTHTNPAGLLWTSDKLASEATTYTTHNKHNTQTSKPSAGFEAVIPGKRATTDISLTPQAHRDRLLLPVPDGLHVSNKRFAFVPYLCIYSFDGSSTTEAFHPAMYTRTHMCLRNMKSHSYSAVIRHNF